MNKPSKVVQLNVNRSRLFLAKSSFIQENDVQTALQILKDTVGDVSKITLSPDTPFGGGPLEACSVHKCDPLRFEEGDPTTDEDDQTICLSESCGDYRCKAHSCTENSCTKLGCSDALMCAEQSDKLKNISSPWDDAMDALSSTKTWSSMSLLSK